MDSLGPYVSCTLQSKLVSVSTTTESKKCLSSQFTPSIFLTLLFKYGGMKEQLN